MPLWGSKDDAANSDIAALMQVNKAMTTANQTTLFGNTTTGAFFSNMKVGQFGVDTNEITAAPEGHGYHAGWVLRKEGTGLRAGRVTYETLVAMGSMTGDAEDTQFPDYKITIKTQPSSSTSNVIGNVTFTVVATVSPSATLAYKWQRNTLAGTGGWVDVANTAGQYFKNTSPSFIANNVTANGNVFRAVISTSGANTVYSSNATINYVA